MPSGTAHVSFGGSTGCASRACVRSSPRGSGEPPRVEHSRCSPCVGRRSGGGTMRRGAAAAMRRAEGYARCARVAGGAPRAATRSWATPCA
eukprot:5323780-Prymnesium_polylepis.2